MFSGPWEILLILAIALLLFGSKKIRTLGSDLGAGLKGFKKSMKDDSDCLLYTSPSPRDQ